jgi:uncharacterized membrane protein
MRDQTRVGDRNSIAAYALWGAIGFAVGGAIAGSLQLDIKNPANPLTMGVMGAIGGASLGLMLRNWKKAGLMALAGGVGFTVSSLPAAMMIAFGLPYVKGNVYVGPIVSGVLILFIYGAVQGLAGAASLLIALRNLQRARQLLMAGTLGFAIGSQAAWGWAMGLPIEITLAIWGAIGGTALGAALGYLEKRRHRNSTD